MENETIVSLATPIGYSGLGLVRISGKNAIQMAKWTSKKTGSFDHSKALLLPLYLGKDKIDQAVYTVFKSPRSYTGEDVVEVSCHGNPLICELAIEAFIKLGARLAEPGEYTKRAFLNGKLTLSQAESVALLISSKSKEAIRSNLRNLERDVVEKIKEVKDGLIDCISSLEYEFDVSEEESSIEHVCYNCSKLLKNLYLYLSDIELSYKSSTIYNHGLRIAIIGKPNAGKSTLLNAITGYNRSIVSEKPGTTRDSIESEIIISGAPVTIIDTAGIHRTDDETERLGIERSKHEIKRASIVLSVFSYELQPVDFIEDVPVIYVYNKEDIKKNNSTIKNAISVSALKKTGIKNLMCFIKDHIKKSAFAGGDITVNTLRQKEDISRCLVSLSIAINQLQPENSNLEIAAFEIRSAISSLSQFTGETTTEEILERVFSNFCVGK